MLKADWHFMPAQLTAATGGRKRERWRQEAGDEEKNLREANSQA